jgi:hypothetical protein
MSFLDPFIFRVYVEVSAVVLMDFPLYATYLFLFCSFHYSFFVLYVECVDYDMFSVILFWF